jgi:hypothetical protein
MFFDVSFFEITFKFQSPINYGFILYTLFTIYKLKFSILF